MINICLNLIGYVCQITGHNRKIYWKIFRNYNKKMKGLQVLNIGFLLYILILEDELCMVYSNIITLLGGTIMSLELIAKEPMLKTSEVKKLQEIVDNFILKSSCYVNHGRHKEVRNLMVSNPGRFVQFDTKKVDTAMVLTINKTAFIAGSRLAYMRRHGSAKVFGKTNRYVVDVYNQPDEKLRLIYGGESFTEVVKAVLTLEKNGIQVPKFDQERLIFSKDKSQRQHHDHEDAVGASEDVSVISPQQVPVPEEKVSEQVENISIFKVNNPEFDVIRETVKAMYVADLLNDKIRSEVNSVILEKLFNMDFVEEILNNKF